MRVLSSELPAHAGERVTMAGWLHAKRELGAVTFVILRDRAGLAQIVAEPPVELSPETVLEVDGVAVAAEQAPGGVELQEPSFRVLSEPAELPPIELRRPVLKESLPTLLDHAPLAWRHPGERAKLAITAASVAGFRRALDGLGFTEISTPKIVASATESGANVFRARLLRAAGVPGAEPAVLQADDGGRLRARLRDREGLARGAARDGTPPRRVHLARRRARLHRRPLRRDGRGSRGSRRDGRRHPRARPRGRRAAGGAGRDPVGALLRDRRRRRRPRAGGRTAAVRGAWRMALRHRLPRRRSGRSTRIPSPGGRSTRTRSTCSSAESRS